MPKRIESKNHMDMLYLLAEAIDSVLAQTFSDFEVLVIDDGSTDQSVDVVRQWYERQPKTEFVRFELTSRPNRGLTRTINELISMASGDYLVLLASDDYLLPEGIVSRVEYLQNHPDKLAVFSDCVVVDEGGKVIRDSGIADMHGGRLNVLGDPDLTGKLARYAAVAWLTLKGAAL